MENICLIALSLPVEEDTRTRRFIELLADSFKLTVIGFGQPPDLGTPYTWKNVGVMNHSAWNMLPLSLGAICTNFYALLYLLHPAYRQALTFAQESYAKTFIACGWTALPIAVAAGPRTPIIFDLDMNIYRTKSGEGNDLRSALSSPLVVRFLRQYVDDVSYPVVASEGLAAKYKEEFGTQAVVIGDPHPQNLTSSLAAEHLLAFCRNTLLSEQWRWHEGPTGEDIRYYMS